jgi:hypothetical protein
VGGWFIFGHKKITLLEVKKFYHTKSPRVNLLFVALGRILKSLWIMPTMLRQRARRLGLFVRFDAEN